MSELDDRPRKGRGVMWWPCRQGYQHGLFYHGSHGQWEQAKKHLCYPEVDTEDVAELKYLKERDLNRKGISWKLTMMPLKEEN